MSPSLDPLLRYFAAEKHGGLVCLGLGVAALVAATVIWRSGAAHRSMAGPLALIGLAQLAVGATLWLRTDGQVAALATGFAGDPGLAATQELARMVKVNRSFGGIVVGEVVLIALATGAIFVWRSRPVVVGIAAGVLLQAAVMLAFDLFAEHRARAYSDWLQSVKPPAVG